MHMWFSSMGFACRCAKWYAAKDDLPTSGLFKKKQKTKLASCPWLHGSLCSACQAVDDVYV